MKRIINFAIVAMMMIVSSCAKDSDPILDTIPADAEVTWTSSDTTKATVEDGVVTGVGAGTVKIKASITTVEGTAEA